MKILLFAFICLALCGCFFMIHLIAKRRNEIKELLQQSSDLSSDDFLSPPEDEEIHPRQ